MKNLYVIWFESGRKAFVAAKDMVEAVKRASNTTDYVRKCEIVASSAIRDDIPLLIVD